MGCGNHHKISGGFLACRAEEVSLRYGVAAIRLWMDAQNLATQIVALPADFAASNG